MQLVFKKCLSINVMTITRYTFYTLHLTICVLNIAPHKNLLKFVQFSKHTDWCHFLYETDPNYVRFSFGDKLAENLGAIGQKAIQKIILGCALNFSINKKLNLGVAPRKNIPPLLPMTPIFILKSFYIIKLRLFAKS